MSKNGKKLLNESTIRRFMKLAEIDTLSDQFVGALPQRDGSGDIEEGMGPYNRDDDEATDDDVMAEEEEPAFDMAEEEGADDAEVELPPEPAAEPEAAGPVDAEAIFTSLAQALAGVAEEHGVSMDIEGGDEGAEAEMGDLGDEDLDMAAAGEEEELPGVELEEEVDEDTMVAEITRRVTARLMKESRNEQVAGDLADRIMSRLKKDS
jgi:hypothetical protein